MKQLLFMVVLCTSQVVFSQDQMYDVCPIKIGEEMPDTKLMNEKGDEIMLSSLTTDKPTVVIFYRGAWCGYCTQHLAELNDAKEEIEALGYQVIGVTVDKPEKLSESSDNTGSEIKVYSDAKLETILAFGLDWKLEDDLFEKYRKDYNLDLEAWSGETHHSLPVPAIFVIKENTIEFQYVNPNYKTRLKAETLIAVLKTM